MGLDVAIREAPAPAMQATVLMTSGLFRTAAGSLGEQWLEEHQEDLRAYLVVRAGGIAAGDLLFDEFREAVRRLPTSQLRRGPTPRARLFLVASQVVELRELLEGAVDGPQVVPWATLPGRSAGRQEAIETLRRSLPDADAELLELHHVRGLSVSDVAYVRSEPEADIVSRLKAAEAYALLLVEDSLGGEAVALDTLLEDAFALEELPEAVAIESKGPPPALGPGTLLAERYEVEAHIAAGAFGHVYRASDVLVPGHQVALKMLHRPARVPAAREGAIRELSLLASVFHPSVVQFKDHGWYDERLWFVMPWYEGETLQARIDREPLAPREAFELFQPLARALAALHRAGIRHQDVKPDNVFLVDLNAGKSEMEPDLLPVLLDLGGATPDGDMTLVGTPVYFAPEVAERFVSQEPTRPMTDRADVFALALSLLHALVPKAASEGAEQEFEPFVQKRADGKVTLPRHVPERSRFERWLSATPSERPSALALAKELKELSLGLDGRPRSALLRFGRRTVTVGAAALLLGVAFLGLSRVFEMDAPGAAAHAAAELWRAPAPRDDRAEVRDQLLEQRVAAAEARAAALEVELTAARQARSDARPADEAADENAVSEEAPPEP